MRVLCLYINRHGYREAESLLAFLQVALPPTSLRTRRMMFVDIGTEDNSF